MWNWAEKLSQLQKLAKPVVLITVIHAKGSTPRDEGTKMIVTDDGECFGTIGGGNLEFQAINKSKELFSTQNINEVQSYQLCRQADQCCGGGADLLYEVFNIPPQLYIFGAGHVGKALANTLLGTPFQVHLIDSREKELSEINDQDQILTHQINCIDFIKECNWNRSKTYVAVMTHSHELDLEIIASIADKPAKYIGLIGSRSKWHQFSLRLKELGLNEDQLHRINTPIGLGIGGKAPQELAISISAELLKFHYSN